ncbi:thioredoxin family protein [Fusibacter ferrireducens]|uniref:Thioredoxin n=1 Tax=Fusibacter ferrireducens TaxID=2785058 RepID=A0ABR9ZU74_9FIRM|nr:thioredoxin domain-containing protein [Fusibacter ferrireducens]MBF4694027.1 thioredoxin [Fusibacter ferrireducens]
MIELNKANFQEEVMNKSGLVIVDFFGDGCEPCKALMPEFEQIATEFDGKAHFGKLNTTAERKLAISQRVLGIPTVVFYKDGQRIAECTKDSANRQVIVENILKHL